MQERILEADKVAVKLINRSSRRRSAANTELSLAKKILTIAINMGSRPLHGVKLAVMIAMSRSRGDSIIRHPVTPAALQPSDMQVVRQCFPQLPAFLKQLSRRLATRGR